MRGHFVNGIGIGMVHMKEACYLLMIRIILGIFGELVADQYWILIDYQRFYSLY